MSAVCTPIKPLPPGLFSTVTGWPVRSPIFLAKMRAPVSVPLPGGNGTMNFTGRLGKLAASPCARAGRAASGASPIAAASVASVCSVRRRVW
ncbi:hypothetical protein D3C87_1528410 [compost metagenome]